jgi:hypothetical protein
VLLALDVLAACGLVWLIGRLPLKSFGRIIAVVGLLVIQAIVVFSHHPYYGTHYNMLPCGAKAAMRVFPLAEWAEGVDLAGRYVDSQPGAEGFIVGTQFLANEMLAQHVRAPVYELGQVKDDADYLVFGVQYTMRGKTYDRWGKEWEQVYKVREPEYVASFGGIPYAWVHRPGVDPTIPHATNVRMGEKIRLEGYRLAQDEVSPGDTLLLTLYWRAEQPVEKHYSVFVHLQDENGNLVAQQDNPPVRGMRPTNEWEPHVLIEDPYEVHLPSDVAHGQYVLSAGMYDSTTVERLAAFDSDGNPLPDDRIVLKQVQVKPVIPWWRWALSGLWVAIVAVGTVWSWFWGRQLSEPRDA